MPLLTTFGSLYETKQVPPRPLPVENITLTRNEGYNITANYNHTIFDPPYDYPITYYGNLKSSNRYPSNSNTTSMFFSSVPPFSNVFATIVATNIIGNSLPATSANYYPTSNLTSNGNITVANASAITISPVGTEVDVGTLNGYLLRYSRNSTTGQLSLISNTFIASNAISSLCYSNDGNFLYIYGAGGSNIYNYNISNSSFNQTGLTNVFPVGGAILQQNLLFTSANNNYIIATGEIPTPVIYRYSVINYFRNTTTGNLTRVSSVTDGANYTGAGNYRPFYNGSGNMTVGHSDGSGNAQFNLYNISGNTIAFVDRETIFLNSNNTSTIANTTIIRNSIHVTISNTTSNQIKSYTYSSTITPTQNTNVSTSGYAFCPVIPESNNETTVLLYNGSTTGQYNGNGTITILSNSSSYVANFSTSAVIANDTKHIYTLTGNTITIYNVGS